MTVAIVQPDPDDLAGQRRADDDVEIVVAVDVGEPDRDRIATGFEGDVVPFLAGDRELETIGVCAAARAEVICDGNIRPAIGVEIADNGRPAERRGGVAEPERRSIRSHGIGSEAIGCRERVSLLVRRGEDDRAASGDEEREREASESIRRHDEGDAADDTTEFARRKAPRCVLRLTDS